MTETLLHSKITNLSNIINDLEQSEKSLIEKLSKCKGYHLQNYLSEIDQRRKEEYDEIKNVVNTLTLQLKEKVNMFTDENFPALTAILDTDKFKNEMLRIQNTIEELKKKSIESLNNLQKQEVELTNEIQTMEECLEVPVNNDLTTIMAPKKVSKKGMSNETMLAREFLTRIYGEKKAKRMNLKPYVELIKLYNHYRDTDMVIDKYKKHRSDTPRKDVMNFTTFLKNVKENNEGNSGDVKYNTKVKKKIDNYLNVDKLKEMLKAKKADKETNIKSPKEKNEPKKLKPRNVKDTEKKNKGNKKIDNYLNIDKLREKLFTWKVEQSNRAKSLEALEYFYKKECLRKEMMEQLKRDQLKQKLEKWKEENKQFDELANMQKMVATKMAKFNTNQREIKRNIKMYQNRDKVHIQRMRQAKGKLPLPSPTKKNNLFTKKVSNLLKNTKQWNNRIKDKTKKTPINNNLRNIQKLGIPDWRKVIS